MDKKPTDAQREAARKEAKDLCVTAGAGSGKTRVLVDRFLHQVIEKKVPVERILAITFTEKAAAEMKGRIAEAFGEAGREDLRREVEFAYISTIDSFCARILRENALEGEVDPRFSVLEEIDARLLLEEAADEILLARDEAGIAELLEMTGIADLTATLCGLYERIRASGKLLAPATLEPPPPPGTAMRDLEAALERVRRVLATEKLTSHQEEKARAQLGLREEIESIPAVAPVPEVASAFRRFQGGINLTGARNETYKSAMISVREALDRCLGEILEQKVRPLRALWGELLASLDAAYGARKRAAAALDFSDLEWKVRGLLAGSPEACRRLAARFDHIFLDEFQDTNPLQKEIVDRIHDGNSFFAAGDAKQSIYGFRDADVRIIAGFRKEVEPEGGHVSLPENFRSRPEIVEFTNRLFSSSLWRPGRVCFEKMTAGAGHAQKEGPSVEVILAAGETAEEGRRNEAEALAERLLALVEGEEIRITREGSERPGAPLGYGDVAILFRSTTGMRTYERALAARQIPYFVQKGRGYFQTQEVRDLVNLIRVLDNPRDDYSLAAVLRSPLGGLDDDDLYRLCRREEGGGGKRLADRVRRPAPGLPETGRRQLGDFLPALDRLRARKGQGPLWLSLDGLLSESLLAFHALLHFNGRRRFANLRKLVDLVRGWEARGKTSLPELVEMLEEYSAPETRESEAAVESAGEDSVRLMTIHAAKGLEFPLVVLADLGRGEKATPHEEIFHRESGLGIPLYDPQEGKRGLHPASYRVLRESQAEAEKQEGNRLQYVAVTRAREHLILSGWWKEGKAPPRSWLEAVLEGLGGAEAVASDRSIRWSDAAPAAPAKGGGRVSLMDRHGDALRALRPLPGVPGFPDAEKEAGEILKRVSLVSPPEEETPYLVTATEIVQHHLCPRRYHLRYLVGAPAGERLLREIAEGEGDSGDPKDDELPAEVLGDRVHRILAEEPGAPVIGEILATLPAPDREIALRQVETFRNSALGREAAAGEAMREFPFALARRNAVVRGQIDLILRGPDGSLKVVDYKTSRIERSEVGAKAADYELQLRIYALAIRDLFGRRPAGAFLHFLHPGVIHEVDVGAAALAAAEGAISAFFDAHRAREYPRHAAPHCRPCGYREAYCPGIAPDGTVRAGR